MKSIILCIFFALFMIACKENKTQTVDLIVGGIRKTENPNVSFYKIYTTNAQDSAYISRESFWIVDTPTAFQMGDTVKIAKQ